MNVDYDNSGHIDGADFLTWQRVGGSAQDLEAWEAGYFAYDWEIIIQPPIYPEPSGAVLFILAAIFALFLRPFWR